MRNEKRISAERKELILSKIGGISATNHIRHHCRIALGVQHDCVPNALA